ncbi:MAG: hypothetical protein JWO67_524 [Streptosporangiaceae bacterium]|nr:hypothetical protein [Streptosporangiaceae bacterium]
MDVRPGFTRLAPNDSGAIDLRKDRKSGRSLRDYLTDLLTDESEPGRPFVDLLRAREVGVELLDSTRDGDQSIDTITLPHAWVVHPGARPDAQLVDNALASAAARRALRQLLDAVPPEDWHIVSTVRSDIQYCLSRRPVGGDLLRAVYP